jgi:hypothetical protein
MFENRIVVFLSLQFALVLDAPQSEPDSSFHSGQLFWVG